MAKARTRNLFRIIVSIVFIIYGAIAAFGAIKGFSLSLGWALEAAVAAVILIAGVLGITKTNFNKCRVLGIIILVLAIVSFVVSGFPIAVRPILSIVLPILYIIGVKG